VAKSLRQGQRVPVLCLLKRICEVGVFLYVEKWSVVCGHAASYRVCFFHVSFITFYRLCFFSFRYLYILEIKKKKN
jgi:hypothetical protein